MLTNISVSREVLDPNIWNVAFTEKVSPYFGKFINFSKKYPKGKLFIKTQFHDYFCKMLEHQRKISDTVEENKNFLVGIQGIGKSASAVFYVLSCIEKGDSKVHYIDMDMMKEPGKDDLFNTLKEYAATMGPDDCVIIDHVTIFNENLVHDMKSIVPATQIFKIETGFSASRHTYSLDIGINLQLDQQEFETMWMLNVEKYENLDRDKENYIKIFVNKLYKEFKNSFIITPRLLHFIRGIWLKCPDENRRSDINFLTSRYLTYLRESIYKFKEDLELELNEERKGDLCQMYSLHTNILLYQIEANSDLILGIYDFRCLKVAINIFQCEDRTVQKLDRENDYRFVQLGLQIGDPYVQVKHLMPVVACYFKEVFDFQIQDLLKNEKNIKNILTVCFQPGGIRKEFEKQLLQHQMNLNMLIVSKLITAESSYKGTETNICKVKQTGGYCSDRKEKITFITPTLTEIQLVEIKDNYRMHDKNLARCATWLKREILKDKTKTILAYSSVGNLKGIDYFFYTNEEVWIEEDTSRMKRKAKKRKLENENTVVLVQVATGASHVGCSVGEALNIFKKIISDINIHVMIVIARKENEEYTLDGKVSFENISVVNLTSPSIYATMQNNFILQGLISLIEM